MYPVKFGAIPMQRIWGGHTLKSMFQVDVEEPIGEYWVVSGHPSGESVVVDGPLAGRTLNDLTSTYPDAYLGVSPQPRFPLLVKFLEAEHDLSVQIHPDDTYAQAYEGDFGKTEAWYVLDTAGSGKVNYGHRFANRAQYEQAVTEGRVREYLSYRPVKKDDLVYVPAQTLHALLAGTKVLEIQQTSDVTYRVYDWDRVDVNGQPRELHVDKAADVMLYGQQPEDVEPMIVRHDETVTMTRLVACKYFTIDALEIQSEAIVQHGHAGNPDIAIVLEGEGILRCDLDGQSYNIPVRSGDAVLVPGNLPFYSIIPTQEPVRIIRSFY